VFCGRSQDESIKTQKLIIVKVMLLKVRFMNGVRYYYFFEFLIQKIILSVVTCVYKKQPIYSPAVLLFT